MSLSQRTDASQNTYDVASLHPMSLTNGFVLIRRWQVFLDVSGRANESTRRQYRRALVAFLADVCKDPREITEDDVIEWITTHDPHGAARGTTLRSLHSFYDWAVTREEVRRSPVRAIGVPRPKYGKAPAMSEAELTLVLQAARRHRDPRVAPMLELMYATGARIGSICGLEARVIVFDRLWISFRVSKNNDPYGIPANDRAVAAVKELLSLANYLPPTVAHRRPTLIGVGRSRAMQWVQDVEDDSGVPCWSHLFRHTLATELAHDATVPLAVVSRILNHRDSRTTMRYISDKEGSMAAALAGR